jgi:hypothetical protein
LNCEFTFNYAVQLNEVGKKEIKMGKSGLIDRG